MSPPGGSLDDTLTVEERRWRAGHGGRGPALVVQEHIRPVRTQPPVGRWPVARVVGTSIELSLRMLLGALAGRTSIARTDRILDSYWRRIFRAGNAALVVEGREHFDGRPAVVMSNHTSLLDIPAIFGAVPGSLRMVMKEEIGRVPLWGKAAIAAGFIPVDRKHHQKAIQQLDLGKQVHAQGVHIWISPEGTRSRGRGLLPFKKGGFHLAVQLGAPIIPTWIEGSEALIQPDSFRVVPDGVVLVRFGPPIETAGRPIGEVMEQTRLAIAGLGDEVAVETGKAAARR